MGGVAILALLSGRPHGGGAALVLAAALLTVPDPRIIEDISFQLSVAATAGLILLSPPMLALGRRLVHEDEATLAVTWRSFVLAAWDVLAVTLAATIATLPILLASFGRLSAVSPLTNLLWFPSFRW
jgi:competence protein ComEC